MKTIGITGGVGAGKSKILAYIQTHCNCRILLADEVAHKVREPGNPCYNALVRLLGTDTLEEDGQINRQKMAAKIFADHKLLEAINAVIHPAVKAYILQEIEAEREAGKIDAFFVEAALLIEEGYGELLDELWYIFAQKEVRRKRLIQDRGYSEEKVEQIFASQLSEEEFRCHCKVVIDNSADLGDTAPACRHFHRCGSSYQSTASSPLKYRFCLSRANQMPAPSPKGQGSNPDRQKRRSPPFSPPYARNVFSVPAPESIESAHSAPFSRFHPTGQTASGQTCASALFLLFPG